MNSRRKIKLRIRQEWERKRDLRNANRGEPKLKPCQRCGQPFLPRFNERIGYWALCCEPCGCRNLYDNFDLPTPPSMLDKFTQNPTLTDEEFYRKLKS